MDELWIVLAVQQAATTHRHRLLQSVELQLEWRRLMRARHYLTTDCLTVPSSSAWTTLYARGDDLNFLNSTSLSRQSFENLVAVFAPFYPIRDSSRSGGRPPKLRTHQEVLGMLLHFYVNSMDQECVCLIFGIPPSTLARILTRAELALSNALRSCHESRISWPSHRRLVEMARLVEAREPLLQHTFGFIDGKNFKVQSPSASNLQNEMYNGWLHSVLVTGTLCFAADGCIIWCRHNCPGSWNDADNSAGFMRCLLDTDLCPDQRYGVVSDSAFPSSKDLVGRILTPLKDGNLDRLLPSRRALAVAKHNAITSVRQAAEWGMGSVDKVYRRLRLPLPYDPQVCGLRLHNLFRLANYRARTVGISQIQNTFAGTMEIWQQRVHLVLSTAHI